MSELMGNLLSAAAGGIVTYFAPWIAWPIEKRREDLAHKRKGIEEWRTELLDIGRYPANADDQAVADRILGTSAYSSLEQHLSEALKARIRELADPTIVMGRASSGRSPGPPPRLFGELSTEVGRIVKDWGVV